MKRGIAGNLVFAVLDRDSLLEEMRKQYAKTTGGMQFPVMFTAAGNAAAGARGLFDEALDMVDWNTRAERANFVRFGPGEDALKGLRQRAQNINPDARMTYNNIAAVRDRTGLAVPQGFDLITPETLTYADTLPPFDVTCTFANEYGQAAFMRILDVDILNDGSGVSVDTVVMERAMTFIARKISPITSGIYDRSSNLYYSNSGVPLTKDGLGV
ncbi:MAG TPA: hypothetical protein VIK82_05190 [Porticoccaceae bacterium]